MQEVLVRVIRAAVRIFLVSTMMLVAYGYGVEDGQNNRYLATYRVAIEGHDWFEPHLETQPVYLRESITRDGEVSCEYVEMLLAEQVWTELLAGGYDLSLVSPGDIQVELFAIQKASDVVREYGGKWKPGVDDSHD